MAGSEQAPRPAAEVRPLSDTGTEPAEQEPARRDQIDDEGARGAISIAPAVLIELIELTARDIDGLVGLARGRRQGRGRVLQIQPSGEREQSGKTYARGGVQVRIDGNEIDADLRIIVRGGANVPQLGKALQRKVAVAVERMLGMTANDVNIHVVEIAPVANPKDDTAP